MPAIGVISKSRQVVARVLKTRSPMLSNSSQFDELVIKNASRLSSYSLVRARRFHSTSAFSGIVYRSNSRCLSNYPENAIGILSSSMCGQVRFFSSEESVIEKDSTDVETAKWVYDKLLNSVVEKRSAPPNAWLWSLIEKCSTFEDAELLFDILKRLRIFRLSNLRIPEDFNTALCREVTKACVRVGAIDLGKKALWKNNLFGLTPNVGSAHHLLLYAKECGNVNLMVDVMQLVKKNDLPLQPGTADIVFSICSSTNRWDLMNKYAKRFVTSGVTLRRASFELWMDFAARKGDANSLWKIEQWRSKSMKQHSLSTGFSCAKGFLLDHKPESAAAIIQELNQSLSDEKKPNIVAELEKLASEWRSEVIMQHQKVDTKQEFSSALQNDISALISALQKLGIKANITI